VGGTKLKKNLSVEKRAGISPEVGKRKVRKKKPGTQGNASSVGEGEQKSDD